MKIIQYRIRKRLRCYVNCVMTDASVESSASMELPLYADGYPGIMYQRSENGFHLLPRNKELSELFLYGQTLQPITLTTKGRFRFIVLQLYPFASKYLLGIDPKILNDDCYDLFQLKNINVNGMYQQLSDTEGLSEQIELMLDLVEMLLEVHQTKENDGIQKAIHQIIQDNGQVKISEIRNQIHFSERTFERAFLKEVGLTPKQFAKIVQFQTSLEKIKDQNFEKLTEIAFDSGFADQSHFIRVFKAYTGLSPKQYRQQAVIN